MSDKRRQSTPQASTVLEDLKVLQRRVAERIQELEPFAEELSQLREQADKLGIDVSTASPRGSSKPSRKRATGKRRQSATTRRRRTSNGTSRADQVLALVRERPPVTIPQLGEALGVDSTGLYRVVRNLESDGLVRKDGRALVPVEQAEPEAVPG